MLNRPYLFTLLDLDVHGDFRPVLIYSEQNTDRLDYVCRFIFNHVLKQHYKITSDSKAFINSGDVKINYSRKEMAGILQIIPHPLLMEKGISEVKPAPVFRKEMIYFYETWEGKDFFYDIFSAVFYFVSRYEEWQIFEPDRHQRFEADASLLYKHKFHLKPVVDNWIYELREALQGFHAGQKFPEKKSRIISTIDVDNLYAYKSKGLLRMLGASAKDLLKADLKNLKERMLVLTGKKKDPFDIYDTVSEFCFDNRIPLIYFFLFRTGTGHDRTVDPRSSAYKKVFGTIKENHALIGLHPSYHAPYAKNLLTDELRDLSFKSDEKISISRQHYLRFNIRSTPGLLAENGIIADFSMGFASVPGFRAGTSHPFYYYDFHSERETGLLFVPFCVMDGAYTVYEKVDPEIAFSSVMELAREVKKVNGLFISVFHERTFSDHLYKGFGTLYKKIHLGLKEL